MNGTLTIAPSINRKERRQCCRQKKKMNYKLKTITAITALALTLSGCGTTTPNIHVNGTMDGVELESATQDSVSLPVYDKNSTEQSVNNITLTEGESYYKTQLSDKLQFAYSEIKNGYTEYKSDVILSKTITPEELFKIISILYMDEPTLFHIKPTYTYNIDEGGYVYKVGLSYSMTLATYETYKTELNANMLSMYNSVLSDVGKVDLKTADSGTIANAEITEYAAINYVLESLFKGRYLSIQSQTSSNGSVSSYLDREYSSHSVSKYLSAILRYLGVESSTTLGVFTNDELNQALTPSDAPIATYSDVSKMTKYNGSSYSVSLDYSGYVAWNLVKINDSWFNIDVAMNHMIGSANELTINTLQEPLTYLINDYTISSTRMSYQSECMLGQSPICSSIEFLYSYRSGDFVLSHTEEQMTSMLTSSVYNFKSQNIKKKVYQFQDEDTLNFFLKKFDDVVVAYNNESVSKILEYEIHDFREALVIVVDGFVYK